jgi:hypothetical protein
MARTGTFFALLTMLSAASALVICDSGWNVYAPSSKPHEFAVMGCDMVYDELIKQAFHTKTNDCDLVSIVTKGAVCLTTQATDRGTCRSDGKYGFESQIIAKCPGDKAPERWITGTIGQMKNGKITLTNFYSQKTV